MVDNFWALAAVLGPGSKAILTCRTEYFTFAKQAREVLGGKLRGRLMRDLFDTTRFQVAALDMFDEKRLAEVLSRRSNDKALIQAILSNQKLFDLGRRPLMVDLLIEAMPDLKAENADLAKVYHQAVQRKMSRDITLGRTFKSKCTELNNFNGSKFESGPKTLDARGAAFSPNESLLAVCERPGVIGFWRTATGDLVGRFTLYPAMRGSNLERVQGLSPEFAAIAAGDGWLFESAIPSGVSQSAGSTTAGGA